MLYLGLTAQRNKFGMKIVLFTQSSQQNKEIIMTSVAMLIR